MPDLSLDPRKTALVAIDLQNAVVGMNTVPYAAAEVVEKNRRIADALRAKGGLVVWVRVDINQFLRLPADEPGFAPDKPMPAELSEIVASAGRELGDLTTTKRHWGAFAGTDLEKQLRNRGIETVILTGISTSIGVESTLRQGTGLGFAFVVVKDACAAQTEDEHRYALEKIFVRLARVRTAAEVIEALA
jgi:nicotinamidase-related amidase